MGLLSSQINVKNMVPICRQLATTYDAGIPILKGLDLVRNGARNRRAQQVLGEIRDQVRNGSTLGGAARMQQKYLPGYFVELLTAGEMSGQLSAMLRDLADYYEDQLAIKRSILGSLVYPAFQLTMAWFLGTFALRLLGAMDFTGRSNFSFGGYLHSYLLFQAKAMSIFGIVVVACIVLARLGLFKWVWGWFATFIWPLSIVTRKFAIARFFRSLSLLVGSGMPIHRCIESAAAITVNPYIEKDLLRAVPRVKDGATLYESFSTTRCFTPVARQMLLVGEQSGNLEQSLLKVSQYHLAEANQAVRVATRAMNVLILLTIASVVGYIYISFFTGYYGKMLDSIK